MISIQVLETERIIVVEPSGALEAADFEKLANEIDSFSGGNGNLIGLIIHTKSFPGWDDFNAFLHHMKFVKDHHKQIQRIAMVTDSKLGELGPSIAKHFISAQIKHFAFDHFDEAKQWIQEAS
jgi:hypothetical protein